MSRKLYRQLQSELTQWNRTRLSQQEILTVVEWLAGRVIEEQSKVSELKEQLTKANRAKGAAEARAKKAAKKEEQNDAEDK